MSAKTPFRTPAKLPMDSIDLSNFACGSVTRPQNLQCSTYGEIIANNLIRVASSRIFSNPQQSILELPVNSIDSQSRMTDDPRLKRPSVGKFGLGFFSILYFVQNRNARVTIQSTYATANSEFRKYSIQITLNQDKLSAVFLEDKILYETRNRIQTGTTIRLDQFPMQPVDESKFLEQLTKLRDIQTVAIRVIPQFSAPFLINTPQSFTNDDIVIQFGANGFTVTDKAQGIPIRVVQTSLLVPSSSTKTLRLSNERKTYDENTRVAVQELPETETDLVRPPHELAITVNQIGLLKIQVPMRPMESTQYSMVLAMPSNTRLPVSRDDLFVEDDSTEAELLRQFKLLANQCISLHNVDPLLQLIRQQSLKSNQIRVFSAMSNLEDYIYREADRLGMILILSTSDAFQKLAKSKTLKLNLLVHPKPNLYKSEEQLRQVLKPQSNDSLFQSKSVVLIDDLDANYDLASSARFIFVKTAFTKQGDYVNTLAFAVPKMRLLPLSLNIQSLPIQQRMQRLFVRLGNLQDDLLLPYATVLFSHQENYESEDVNRRDAAVYSQLTQATIMLSSLRPSERKSFTQFLQVNFVNTFHEISQADNFLWFAYVSDIANDITDNSSDFLQSILDRDVNQERTELIANLRSMHFDYTRVERNDENDESINVQIERSKFVQSWFAEKPNQMYKDVDQKMLYWYVGTMVQKQLRQCATIWASSFSFACAKEASSNPSVFASLASQWISDENLSGPQLWLLRFVGNCLTTKNDVLSTVKTVNMSNAIVIQIAQAIKSYVKIKFDSRSIETYLTRSFWLRDEGATLQVAQQIVKPTYEFAVQYVRVANNIVRNLPPIPKQSVMYTFTAKSLMSYIFTFNQSKDYQKNSLQWLKQVSEYSTSFDSRSFSLQALEIAVNEGTTKQFMRAILTELIQNSMDAIRQSKAAGQTLQSKIDTLIGSNAVQVTDQVGIPNDGILSIMVPFLSTKSAKDAASTGEMGTGFFNVYRRPFSSRVFIDTERADGSRIQILGLPQIEDEKVIDVQYIVNVSQSNQRRKTSIRIEYENVGKSVISDNIQNGFSFCNAYLGFTKDIVCSLNEEILRPTLTVVQSDDIAEQSVIDGSMTESVVLTNGVPFTELVNWTNQLLGQTSMEEDFGPLVRVNTCINFKKGIQAPTQSRTAITFTDSTKAIQSIRTGLFKASMFAWTQREDYHYGPLHGDSRSDPKQLRPGNLYGDERAPKQPNSKEELQLIISELIDQYIIKANLDHTIFMTSGGPYRTWSDQIATKLPESFPLVEQDTILKNAILKWFSNKAILQPPKTGSISPRDVPDDTEAVLYCTRFWLRFCHRFHDIAAQLVQSKILKGPFVFSRDRVRDFRYFILPLNTLGFQTPGDHTLHLSKIEQKPIQLYESLIRYKKLPRGQVFQNLRDELPQQFSPAGPKPPTIIHELMHSYLDDQGEGHRNVTFTLRGQKQTVSFDDACLQIYVEVSMAGLFEGLFH